MKQNEKKDKRKQVEQKIFKENARGVEEIRSEGKSYES